MKRVILAVILILNLAASTWASITLDITKVQTFAVGAAAFETDDTAALIWFHVDYQSNTATLDFAYGTMTAGVFTRGATTKDLVLSIQLASGAITYSDGTPNGTLTPAQLTPLQNRVTGVRNGMETFVVNKGLVVGTQVPW